MSNREKLQAALNRLIVSVFRRRPQLHYFQVRQLVISRRCSLKWGLTVQGYHDIVSVVFLTLPRELHLPVTEKLSLHRVRDSMGVNLDPVVGLLRYAIPLITLECRSRS